MKLKKNKKDLIIRNSTAEFLIFSSQAKSKGIEEQPWFHDWAFNRKRGEVIRKHWELIPHDIDVLITHGPPQGILDLCFHGERVGCSDLLEFVKKIKPRVHAFGHIHESYGSLEIDKTIFINACNLNESYMVAHPPIDIEI